MKKRTKVILIILAAVVVLQAAWIAFCGWKWGWGPFHKLSEYRYRSMPGNADRYAVSQVKPSGDETLKGKTVIFLGSSVTYGAASLGESFADDLGARLQCNVVKEAVSGTTLSTTSPNSYVKRFGQDQSAERRPLCMPALDQRRFTEEAVGENQRFRADGGF